MSKINLYCKYFYAKVICSFYYYFSGEPITEIYLLTLAVVVEKSKNKNKFITQNLISFCVSVTDISTFILYSIPISILILEPLKHSSFNHAKKFL